MSHPNSPWHFSASPRPGMWAKAVRFFSSLSTLRVRPLLFVLAGVFLCLLAAYALGSDVEAGCVVQGVGDLALILICWFVSAAGFVAGILWATRKHDRDYLDKYPVRDFWQ